MSVIIQGLKLPAYQGEHKEFDRYGCFLTVYKTGKVVFSVKGYVSGIESGKTEEAKFYTNQYLRLAPEYNSEMMEFDDYKVFIQGARYSNEDAY